jgi:hypothetical protein
MGSEVWTDKDEVWGVRLKFSSGFNGPYFDERGSTKKETAPQLKQLVAGFQSRRAGFATGS